MPTNERLVLDTHVWIWLLNGDSRLKGSPCLQPAVDASHTDGLVISAISVWETAMLEAKERISFATDISTWVADALRAPGLTLAPLTPEIAIDSTRLPGEFHGDPADRIIIATARHYRCPVVTADRQIRAYADKGWVQVLPV